MAKESKGEKGLAKRVSNIEREMKEMRATAPPRPEDQANAVDERLAALGGVSNRQLEPDATRGASSPLTQPKRRR